MFIYEAAREEYKKGGYLPTSLYLHRVGGLDVNSGRSREWDPYMKRDLEEYLEESLAKGWQFAPSMAPKIMFEVGGNLFRRVRGYDKLYDEVPARTGHAGDRGLAHEQHGASQRLRAPGRLVVREGRHHLVHTDLPVRTRVDPCGRSSRRIEDRLGVPLSAAQDHPGARAGAWRAHLRGSRQGGAAARSGLRRVHLRASLHRGEYGGVPDARSWT